MRNRLLLLSLLLGAQHSCAEWLRTELSHGQLLDLAGARLRGSRDRRPVAVTGNLNSESVRHCR